MKNIIALFLLLLSHFVVAGELIRVQNSPNNSCGESGCMYDEWKLNEKLPGHPSLFLNHHEHNQYDKIIYA
ncbi:hypothetical protein ACUR5C_02705 [Aliikangiella sp. IMCC44653]